MIYSMKMRGVLLILSAVAVANCHLNVKEYLTKFGYANSHAFNERPLNDSIKYFQHTFGLKETGTLDKETLKLMETPRCGVQDHLHAYMDSRWRKTDLTYSFDSYTPDMTNDEVERLTRQALNYWADVTPLKFTKVDSKGDILISFGAGVHFDSKGTCRFNFDGPSGTLAHAFFPENGRIHFDEAEDFTANSPSGVNYLWVATHELGHILGLEHDTVNTDAVMFPYYREYDPSGMNLHANDVFRIQKMYGPKVVDAGCADKMPACAAAKDTFCGPSATEEHKTMAKLYCRKTCGLC